MLPQFRTQRIIHHELQRHLKRIENLHENSVGRSAFWTSKQYFDNSLQNHQLRSDWEGRFHLGSLLHIQLYLARLSPHMIRLWRDRQLLHLLHDVVHLRNNQLARQNRLQHTQFVCNCRNTFHCFFFGESEACLFGDKFTTNSLLPWAMWTQSPVLCSHGYPARHNPATPVAAFCQFCDTARLSPKQWPPVGEKICMIVFSCLSLDICLPKDLQHQCAFTVAQQV